LVAKKGLDFGDVVKPLGRLYGIYNEKIMKLGLVEQRFRKAEPKVASHPVRYRLVLFNFPPTHDWCGGLWLGVAARKRQNRRQKWLLD